MSKFRLTKNTALHIINDFNVIFVISIDGNNNNN